MALLDRCVFLPVSPGIADFVVSSAVLGFQTPAQAGAVNGTTYSYVASSSDDSIWEIGRGVYTSGVLTRATVLFSSASGAKVNFNAVPSVSIDALAEDILTVNNPPTMLTPNFTIADSTSIGTPNLILYNGLTAAPGSFVGSGLIFNCNNSAGQFHTSSYVNGGYVDNTAGHEKGLIDFEVYRGFTGTNLIVSLACNDSAFWFAPGADNICSLGLSGFKWSNIFTNLLTMGAFVAADTYSGGAGIITATRGTLAAPITDSGATAVFQSVSSITSGSGVTVYGSLIKKNTANIESHVFFGEAVDSAGGGSIAGGRFTANLLGGTGGNGTGCTAVGLSDVPYAFVVGSEGQCWLGVSAQEATTTFHDTAFACGFLASCAWLLSADAGFVINPEGYTPGHAFITGFLVPTTGAGAGLDTVQDTAFRCDASCVYGLDLGRGTYSGAPIVAPLKTPASSSATGKIGSVSWDTGFIYICTATNTWKRATLATF